MIEKKPVTRITAACSRQNMD